MILFNKTWGVGMKELEHWWIVPLCAAILIKTVLIVPLAMRPETAFEPDSFEYIQLASHWMESYFSIEHTAAADYAAMRLPLYPLLLALLGSAVLVMQLFLSLSILFVHGMFDTSRRTKLLWWTLALDPLWTVLPTLYLTETLFGFFIVAALFMRNRASGWSGFAAALAALTRPLGLFLLPFFLLLSSNRRRFMLGLLPLFLFLCLRTVQFGIPVYSTQIKLYFFATEEDAKGTEGRPIAWNDPAQMMREIIKTAPKVLLGASTESIVRRFGQREDGTMAVALKIYSALQSLLLFSLAFVGLRYHTRRTLWLLFGLLVIMLAPPIIGLGYGRYRFPAIPILALLAAQSDSQ